MSDDLEAGGEEASLPGPARPRTLRLLLRIAIAVALLAAVLWYARPAAVLDVLRGVAPVTFLLALAVAIASNIASALRWATIARAMGLRAPNGQLVVFYARGMAANTVLPGAVLGGDVLRAYSLHRLGNALQESALSVLVDRLSGLWVLCVLSLVAVLGIAVARAVGADVGAHLSRDALVWAAVVLALACAIPFLTARLSARADRFGSLGRIARGTKRARDGLLQLRPALPRLLAMSVVVQLLSAAALWLYGWSIGADFALPVALAAAAPIFVMAALPIGYAGFGTREFAAVVVLAVAGVLAEAATGTALLYGIGTLLQGLLGAVLFLYPAGAQEAQHPGPRMSTRRRQAEDP